MLRLGVPLLVVDSKRPVQVSGLATEIARLGPARVLAMSPGLARVLRRHVQAPVVTDPAALPRVSPGTPASSVVVLVRSGRAGTQGTIARAASATARAAGATVISVHGSDLRTDPRAIKSLATQPSGQVLGAGGGFGPARRLSQRVAAAKTGVQLPGGGQKLFPGRRLVALYGDPGTASLGVLGEQDLSASIARAKDLAARYQRLSPVPVVAAFEIIATVADSVPGADGNYSSEASVDALRPWVQAARAAGVYVVLDLQPGRADLLDQAKRYAPLLKLPNVGLALDPEWKLTSTQVPLQQIGHVDAAQINAVSRWLSELTAKNTLPQKLLVLHQFQIGMIRHEQDLDRDHDNIQVLIHMDGQGTQSMKDATWKAVKNAAPTGMPFGWKDFYDEDHPMLTPAQTMAQKPTPMMISYQ